MTNILEITDPFWNKSGWYSNITHAEEVFHLRGENSECNAARKTYYYRIRDEFEYCAHLAQSHDDKYDSGHDGGKCEALNSILGDNSGYDNYECTSRPTDQKSRSSEYGD